ncbi:MAG: DUF424 family protein [Euryarchaeota archaeon]|nr:DUF424 family protein [Euryarchaeota archaeon]
MISVKRHGAGSELLVAACDLGLVGRRFEEGELCLELRPGFYGGERVDRRLFLELLAIATIANLAGEETVGAAVEAGLVDPGCVIRIGGVPHAQFLRM